MRPTKQIPRNDAPSITAVVPPSGTDDAGTVVEDEKVNVARFNVCAEKSQCPTVSNIPVICAVPVPDRKMPVGEVKSTCSALRSNE